MDLRMCANHISCNSNLINSECFSSTNRKTSNGEIDSPSTDLIGVRKCQIVTGIQSIADFNLRCPLAVHDTNQIAASVGHYTSCTTQEPDVITITPRLKELG
jgi:hypothetical protein